MHYLIVFKTFINCNRIFNMEIVSKFLTKLIRFIEFSISLTNFKKTKNKNFL
jgi:hypothetical protein